MIIKEIKIKLKINEIWNKNYNNNEYIIILFIFIII